MTSLPAGIKSLVFDLGGVIIDVLPERTVLAFSTSKSVGIHTIHITYPDQVIDLFRNYE